MMARGTGNQMMTDGGWGEERSYVTLAKAGGRRDLLYHQEYSRDESQAKDETMYSYPRVDWFDHPSPSPPPYHDRQDSRVQETILSWPMQEVASCTKRKRRPAGKLKLPSLTWQQQQQHIVTSRQKSKTKLPPLNPPSTITKLLSWEYQKEWISSNDEKIRQRKQEQQKKRQRQQLKLQQHAMRKTVGVLREEEGLNTRFIMKRFASVPSRVKLPPLPSHNIHDDIHNEETEHQ